jgi:hypothetical protein
MTAMQESFFNRKSIKYDFWVKKIEERLRGPSLRL